MGLWVSSYAEKLWKLKATPMNVLVRSFLIVQTKKLVGITLDEAGNKLKADTIFYTADK